MADPSNSEIVVPEGVARRTAANLEGRTGRMGDLDQSSAAGLPYGVLNQRNPEHRGEYWEELRALYTGGSRLLQNEYLLERVFPKHRQEHASVYSERKRRAFYVPYPGEIISDLISTMCREHLQMVQGDDEELPEYYREFFEDVSPEGGEKCSFHDTVRNVVRDAMQTRWSWVRVDLPKPGDGEERPATLAEQEKAGLLDAYVVEVPAEAVIDWETDDAGELQWVWEYSQQLLRNGPTGKRDTVVRRWRFYDAGSWKLYELRHKKNVKPDENTVVPLVAEGVHSFGRVPFVRFALPHDLWAMEKLESLAREHFNKRSGVAWGELQSLLPELYEFLAPPTTKGGAVIGGREEDDARAINQARGQGFVQQRTAEDRAEYIGPDPGSFAQAAESCKELRDEMHRVTHQMALTVDNSAAALRRSADSKTADQAAKNVVLDAIAQLARKFAIDVADMVSRGRGDDDMVGNWGAKGLDEFDPISRPNLVAEATEMELIRIPSATFQREYKTELVRALLPNANKETIETIVSELETMIKPEDFELPKPGDDAGNEDKGDDPPPKKE